jgi:hypothetical protein
MGSKANAEQKIMPIIVRANAWEKRRPMILTILCLVFAAWFAYDGWINWPGEDDSIVHDTLNNLSNEVTPADRTILEQWHGWYNASEDQRDQFTDLVRSRNWSDDWHSSTDISIQRWIVLVLLLGALCGLVWYIRVLRQIMIADEFGLTLLKGRKVAWDRISRIDNRRWASDELVVIEYQDTSGNLQKLVLDAVLFDNLPAFLNEIANRSIKAQIIHPEETPKAS